LKKRQCFYIKPGGKMGHKFREGEIFKGQPLEKREGINRLGTPEFLNRVEKSKRKAKAAKQARKKNRKKK